MKGITAHLNSMFGYRYVKTKIQHMLEFHVFGIKGHAMYNPRFDKRSDGTRAILSFGFDRKRYIYGVLFQHYREGFEFEKHKDGVSENLALTFVLRRPIEGGVFSVDGPLQSWLNGRILKFDGGRHMHGVSKITKGSRTVLILQRGKW